MRAPTVLRSPARRLGARRVACAAAKLPSCVAAAKSIVTVTRQNWEQTLPLGGWGRSMVPSLMARRGHILRPTHPGHQSVGMRQHTRPSFVRLTATSYASQQPRWLPRVEHLNTAPLLLCTSPPLFLASPPGSRSARRAAALRVLCLRLRDDGAVGGGGAGGERAGRRGGPLRQAAGQRTQPAGGCCGGAEYRAGTESVCMWKGKARGAVRKAVVGSLSSWAHHHISEAQALPSNPCAPPHPPHPLLPPPPRPQVVQFGLSAFVWDPAAGCYRAHTFNIYVW